MSEQPPVGGFLLPEHLRTEILALSLETQIVSAPVWYETPAARRPVSRWTRMRCRLDFWRDWAADLAYRVISGHDVPEQEW